MTFRTAMTTVIAAAAAVPAVADVTYTSQTRTVRAAASSAGVNPDVQTAAAPDFGPWHAEVFARSVAPPGHQDSTGHAIQTSTLTDQSIVFTGRCVGYDGYSGGGAGGGSGRSILDVIFEFEGEPTMWSLEADGPRGMLTNTEVKFERLSGGGGVLFHESAYYEFPPWTASGTLTEGTYRVYIEVLGAPPGLGTGASGGDYDVRLMIPGPGSLAIAGLGGVAALRRRR